MDTVVKIWLIAGAVLVVLGLILFTVVMTLNHWDFHKLSTVKYETSTHSVLEDFSDISIKTDTANILFVPSDEGLCQVVCYEAEEVRHSVSVEDGCLTVRVNDQRKWYQHIGIYNGTPKITVSLPQTVYQTLSVECSTGHVSLPADFRFDRIRINSSTGNVECLASAADTIRIKVSTGNILAENLTTGTMDLTTSTGRVTASNIDCSGSFSIQAGTGRVTLTDSSCGSLTSIGSTGKVRMENVVAVETLSIQRSTGNVELIQCDAAELFIKTDTGHVSGSLLSPKVFITQTDTGRVNVPKTGTGGRCEITTDTGSINITVTEP